MRITDAARCLETPATPDGTFHRESTLLRAANVCVFVLDGLSRRLSRWLCHHLFRGGRLLRICKLLCLRVLCRCGRRLLERRISRLGALTTRGYGSDTAAVVCLETPLFHTATLVSLSG